MKKGLTINEASYTCPNGKKHKVAVFLYSGLNDPTPILNEAVSKYVGKNENYIELISASLDNPWMRVVLEGVNDMKQTNFNPNVHKLVQIKGLKHVR